MAVALVNSSQSGTGATSSTTSVTTPVPSGAAAGQIAVLIIDLWNPAAATVTWPSGFTEKINLDSGSQKIRVGWKRLTGADSGNYVATFSTAQWPLAHCLLISGAVATGDPFEATNTATATSTSIPSTTVTTTTQPFLVHSSSTEQAVTALPPTSYTELRDGTELHTNYRIPGTTGSHTASGGTVSASSLMCVALLAVQAAAGGTTPVTATRATTWRVRSVVANARATTWDALSARTSTRATTWDVLTPATATRATTWRVVARTTGTRATTWRVRAVATASRSTTWDVASTLTSVSAARATTWAVDARVASSRATTWKVAQWVTASRTTSWHTLGRLTATRLTTWVTRATISSARATTWRISAQVTATRSTTWAVLVIIGDFTPALTTTASVRAYSATATARDGATATVRDSTTTATVRSPA